MSHIEAAHQAIEKIKQFGSSLDGWTFHSENKGIKIYTQEKEKGAMPAVRGEGILEGYTVHQIAAVAESIGCRPLWDGRFGGAERIEFLQDNTFIFWNSNKGIWPVSDRDLCGVSTFETSPEGTYYSGLTSIVDSRVPEKKGAVRADLHIGGWIIQPEGENSVKATYIIDIDLKGSIPGALVRKVSIDTPLCVAHVFEFLKKYGNPPYLTGLKGHIDSEHFSPKEAKWETKVKAANCKELTVIVDSEKMYPKGWKFTVSPETGAVVEISEKLVHVKLIEDQEYTLTITRK